MQERSLSERARALSPPRLPKTLMSRTYVRARSHLVCARAAGILERIFASLVARGEEHGNARRRADDSLIVLLSRARPSAACLPPTRVVNFNEATPRRRLRLRGIYVCLAVICIPNFRKKQKRKWPAAGLVIAVIRMSDRVEPVTRKGRLVFFRARMALQTRERPGRLPSLSGTTHGALRILICGQVTPRRSYIAAVARQRSSVLAVDAPFFDSPHFLFLYLLFSGAIAIRFSFAN